MYGWNSNSLPSGIVISPRQRSIVSTGFFLCVFEKLKVKKTQALKKLNVFPAQKLKLPEVFRAICSKLKRQSIKNSRKSCVLPWNCLKMQFSDEKRVSLATKPNIWSEICQKLKDFWPKLNQFFQKKSKTQAKLPENSTKLSQKLKVPEVFKTGYPGKIAPKKAWIKWGKF